MVTNSGDTNIRVLTFKKQNSSGDSCINRVLISKRVFGNTEQEKSKQPRKFRVRTYKERMF